MNPTASPDLCCPVCGDTFVVTGEHPCQRAEALASRPGCCVEPARIVRIQNPAAAIGEALAAAANPSGAAGSGAPTGAPTPAPSSNGSAPDVCPVAARSGGAGGGWLRLVLPEVLVLSVAGIAFLVAFARHG